MAQSEVFTETIDGVEYRMRPLPPRQALKLLHRVLQIAAPALGSTIDGLGSNPSAIMQQSIEKLGLATMFAGALERMTDKDLDWATDLLARQCEVVKGPNEAPRLIDVFDLHFQGRIRHYFAWFIWAAKNQYSDFFNDSAPNDDPPS